MPAIASASSSETPDATSFETAPARLPTALARAVSSDARSASRLNFNGATFCPHSVCIARKIGLTVEAEKNLNCSRAAAPSPPEKTSPYGTPHAAATARSSCS